MTTCLDVTQAADEFETLLGKLHVRNLPEFLELIEERIARERRSSHGAVSDEQGVDEARCLSENVTAADDMMHLIAAELLASPLLPPSAVLKTEKIFHPTTGEFAALDPITVVSVDKFLYEDDDAIDEMCDEGMLSRNYCLECGSQQTAPLNFVSHSASLLQLKFIFQKALPNLAGKTVVDIGSRLGPVLYAAYYYSNASRIVGIEVVPDFCAMKENIIKMFGLGDRLTVINDDVCTQASILHKADVIVMQNPFEFFAPSDVQTSIWKFLRREINNKGSLLVTIPSLKTLLAPTKLTLDLSSWVRPVPLDHLSMWVKKDEDREEIQLIHVYEIL